MSSGNALTDVGPQSIPIATVTSSTYLRQTLIMIWSVALSRASDSHYHFYLLHNTLNQDDQCWLTARTRMLDCCEIDFVDVRKWQRDNALEENNWDGKIPCLSLLCPYILPEEEKILMLDGDLVAQRDVAELFQTDLNGAYIGAVYDLDFIGQWRRGNCKYHRYYTQQVPLPKPSEYMQSGVLLADLRALRENYPPLFFYIKATGKRFQYDDQDILNLYCANHFMKLDYKWNVVHDNNHYRIRYIMQFAPKKEFNAYLASRETPYIVHYAGDEKPWNSKGCDLYDCYWNIVRQTPFASEYSEPFGTAVQPWKHRLKTCLHEAVRIADRVRLRSKSTE